MLAAVMNAVPMVSKRSFRCPHCGESARVTAPLDGGDSSCPACGGPVILPSVRGRLAVLALAKGLAGVAVLAAGVLAGAAALNAPAIPARAAATSGKTGSAPVLKAVERASAVTIPDGPVKGTVRVQAWEVKRARLAGDRLYLYPEAERGTPVLEVDNLAELIRNSLAKDLLEKAMLGDKAAEAMLKAIPERPALENTRIALDKEDGLLAMTKARVRLAGGSVYHCDLALPLVVEFGKKADGKVPLAVYFHHEFGADTILLGGHVDATVE